MYSPGEYVYKISCLDRFYLGRDVRHRDTYICMSSYGKPCVTVDLIVFNSNSKCCPPYSSKKKFEAKKVSKKAHLGTNFFLGKF